MTSSGTLLKPKHMSVVLVSNIYYYKHIFKRVNISLTLNSRSGNSSLSSIEADIVFKVPLHGRSLAYERNS